MVLRTSLVIINILLFIMILNGCSRTVNKRSESENEIIKEISQSNLIQETKDWPEIGLEKLSGLRYVGYIHQKTDNLSDGPRFLLFYHEGRDFYFLMITGGFTGETTWKGPFTVTPEGLTRGWLTADYCNE